MVKRTNRLGRIRDRMDEIDRRLQTGMGEDILDDAHERLITEVETGLLGDPLVDDALWSSFDPEEKREAFKNRVETLETAITTVRHAVESEDSPNALTIDEVFSPDRLDAMAKTIASIKMIEADGAGSGLLTESEDRRDSKRKTAVRDWSGTIAGCEFTPPLGSSDPDGYPTGSVESVEGERLIQSPCPSFPDVVSGLDAIGSAERFRTGPGAMLVIP